MPSFLDWDKLRTHSGSCHAAFEQLCAILSHRDPRFAREQGWKYVRNGTVDGGVECLWKAPSGEVRGLQAKYHRASLGATQWNELTRSFKHALESYPTLRSFLVCMPQDMAHSPRSGSTTARQKWDNWTRRCGAFAKRRGRAINFEFWGTQELTSRLADPSAAGVHAYFFDSGLLSPKAMSEAVDAQVQRAGPRYQPDVHVGSELEALFDSASNTPQVRSEFRERVSRVRLALSDASFAALVSAHADGQACQRALHTSLVNLSDYLRIDPPSSVLGAIADVRRRWSHLLDILDALEPAPRSREGSERDSAAEEQDKRWNAARAATDHVRLAVGELVTWAQRKHIHAIDSRVVMVHGSGGCGKTHLLCNLAVRAARAGHPVVLSLGHRLNVTGLLPNVVADNDLAVEPGQFLAALNAAGESKDCRSLLLIDAINEAENWSRWPAELNALVARLRQYPHVVAIVTIRDTYVDVLWPSGADVDGVLVAEHRGFSQSVDQAIERYCEYFNITRPDIPVLHPGFENPLFLSLFCRAIAGDPDPHHERRQVAFPGGSESMERVFDLFVARREQELLERLDLDRDGSRTPLADAVDELAAQMATSGRMELPVDECKAIVAKHLRGRSASENLLLQLEGDGGLLLRNPRRGKDGTLAETMQFAYDRLGAHLVVRHWLSKHRTPRTALGIVRGGGPLGAVDNAAFRDGYVPSLCESLLMQWPAKFGDQLFESSPSLSRSPSWRSAFFNAAALAAPQELSRSTAKWLVTCLDVLDTRERAGRVRRLLRRVGNRPLIDALHRYLSRGTLADRDAWWTTGLASLTADDPLVCWPTRRVRGLHEDDVVLDYATSLAWLTATTVVPLRAAATRSIAVLLDGALTAGAALLRRFAGVNDPYVLQSVCTAVYGAVLRGTSGGAVSQVATAVIESFPRKRDWPLDILSRHALRGIVEYAKHLDSSLQIDLARVRPPYQSPPIGTLDSWARIQRRVKPGSRRAQSELASIVSSCSPEGRGMYGDFGRYVVSTACGPFFPPPRFNLAKRRTRPFSWDTPHRFIVTRVLSLGWNARRFEEFDSSYGGGSRSPPEIERIGKKYQRIALSEFLARAADRHPLFDDEHPVQYEHPGQLHAQFIVDPSLCRVGDSASTEASDADTWKRSHGVPLWDGSTDTQWLMNDHGLFDPKDFIHYPAHGGVGDMVVLHAYLDRAQRDPRDGNGARRKSRRVWTHIRCFGVREHEFPGFREWMSRTRADNSTLPRPRELYHAQFGELYWSHVSRWELAQGGDDPDDPWCRATFGEVRPPCDLIPMAAEYLNESEHPHGPTIHQLIPSKWVVDALRLRPGPIDLAFTDQHGKVVCGGSALVDSADSLCVCDMEPLASACAKQSVRLVWCTCGEKNVLWDGLNDDGPRWPWIQGCYWLESGVLVGDCRVDFDEDFRANRRRSRPQRISASVQRLGQFFETPAPDNTPNL